MGAFFIYILKSSVFLVLFYLCYRVLLSKETFHRFNRIVLLGTVVFSFLLPLIEVTWPKAPEMSQPFLLLENALETVEIKRLDVLNETPKRFTWNALTFLIYASGILFFLLRYVWSMVRMFRLIPYWPEGKDGRWNYLVYPSDKGSSFQLDEADSDFRGRFGKAR